MKAELPLSYRVPVVDSAAVGRFVAERFGLTGELSALPGERDRNFRLDAADGTRYVVKVAHGDERPEAIELQHAALARIAERAADLALPRVVTASSGQTIERLAIDGHDHLVRVLTWVAGVPLATVRHCTVADSVAAILETARTFENEGVRGDLRSPNHPNRPH